MVIHAAISRIFFIRHKVMLGFCVRFVFFSFLILFMFGCAASLLLHGLSQVGGAGATLAAACELLGSGLSATEHRL